MHSFVIIIVIIIIKRSLIMARIIMIYNSILGQLLQLLRAQLMRLLTVFVAFLVALNWSRAGVKQIFFLVRGTWNYVEQECLPCLTHMFMFNVLSRTKHPSPFRCSLMFSSFIFFNMFKLKLTIIEQSTALLSLRGFRSEQSTVY